MSEKIALITGAGSGIGKAIALELGKKGYDLILTGRRKDRLQKIADQVHTKTHIFTFDIADGKTLQKIIRQNKKIFSQVEVLVNNAGLAKGVDKVQKANASDMQEMIDTNVSGLIHLTQQVLPFMVKKNCGHVVNLGSVAGRWVYPGGAVYCATKHAVRAFSEGLRMDLLGTGVRVTNIEPGMVETEFSIVRFNSKKKADAVYAGMVPLSAQDVAEAIVWSLDRPQHVNIQELVIYPTDQAHVNLVHRRNGLTDKKRASKSDRVKK